MICDPVSEDPICENPAKDIFLCFTSNHSSWCKEHSAKIYSNISFILTEYGNAKNEILVKLIVEIKLW